ncbi:stAR-related lipid transfer protein 5 isoform X2 [Lagenorhynchus albirostris]|uniref:stAR-related lipid transfer protein 5 isoform X2 n=1 Tax=Lagenorhynchus albirostris TaxID=27610 RepID=UPI0028EB4A9E|nr:stAR-related lipid transfer protein 5 isoform X2 [Lagenorhynchus albirostris]
MDPALAAQISEVVAEKMLQYRRDESGWKICREGNGVSVSWRPSVEFPGNLYRGEGIVNGTPEQVWDCVKPLAGTLRDKWDENVNSFEIIESITDTQCVSRTTTPSAVMKLISPRDFVDLVLVKTYEDGTISSNATSVEHLLCPPKPGYVRGFNHPCGCFCGPLPGPLERVSGAPRSCQTIWRTAALNGQSAALCLFLPGPGTGVTSLKAFAE